jgi:hypothetical protein
MSHYIFLNGLFHCPDRGFAKNSVGSLGVLILLHHCREVNTFGFTGDTLEQWYYNKRPEGRITPKDQWLRNTAWSTRLPNSQVNSLMSFTSRNLKVSGGNL